LALFNFSMPPSTPDPRAFGRYFQLSVTFRMLIIPRRFCCKAAPIPFLVFVCGKLLSWGFYIDFQLLAHFWRIFTPFPGFLSINSLQQTIAFHDFNLVNLANRDLAVHQWLRDERFPLTRVFSPELATSALAQRFLESHFSLPFFPSSIY